MDGPGYLGELNSQQEAVLYQFKEWMRENNMPENPWFNDTVYLRFCRARKFDLDKIKIMWQNYLEYRQEQGIDDIMTRVQFTKRSQLQPYNQRGYYGMDKKGRPMYIERAGKHNPTKIFEIVTDEEFWEAVSKSYEEVLKLHFMVCSKISGQQIAHTFSITDLSGFSMSMMNSKIYNFIQRASKITQDNYPEQLGQLCIVNAPWSFTAVWSIVKGWLDEKTRQKIQMVGGKPLKELLKYVDEENIPDFLGGPCTRSLEEDHGPWSDYEVIDGQRPGDIVGIRKKGDPEDRIFTPYDFESLPNPMLDDPQNSVRFYESNLKKAHQEQLQAIQSGALQKQSEAGQINSNGVAGQTAIEEMKKMADGDFNNGASGQKSNQAGTFHFDSDQKFNNTMKESVKIKDNYISTTEELKKSQQANAAGESTSVSQGQAQRAASQEGGGHGDLKFTPSLLECAKENEMVQKYLQAETKKFTLKSQLQRLRDQQQYERKLRMAKSQKMVSTGHSFWVLLMVAILGTALGAYVQTSVQPIF